MTGKDYAYYDYLIGMEQWNLRNMYRLAGVGPEKDSPKKIWRLLDFGSRPATSRIPGIPATSTRLTGILTRGAGLFFKKS